MAIKDDFKQSHFILYELQLPYCSACTPSGDLTAAWHTPLTCIEASDQTYSLWFTRNAAPTMSPPSPSIAMKSKLNSSVFRVVSNASESTPRIKPGEGMASRGTMSVSMSDFKGDPGPINFSETGTFFGKLMARNVLDGKKIISHYYSITPDSETPVEVSTSTHYIENASLTGGKFTLQAKDALKDLEAFSQRFPIPTEARLTADIDTTTTTIPVSDGSLFAADEVIIIDKELMRIQSISVNDLTVYARGSTYLATDLSVIYKTDTSTHSVDSAVQICYVMKKTFLSTVLQDIFNAVGLGAFVNFTQWDDEISDWNENAWLYGVFHEPTEADDLINSLLSDYMIDMWLDQATQKAKVSATTAWKQAIRTITEDNDFTGLSTRTESNTRYSRAYIYNNKDYQAENDDTTNYSQLTLYKDVATESSDLYGTVKVKEFDPSNFITKGSAEILVSRFVQRFARTPQELSFKMEERKLAGSGISDIVDIVTRDSQTPSGEFLESRIRAQLIEVKPSLNDIGRTYNVKALSYVPLIASSGGELIIFISGTLYDVNLYSRAGAPPEPINATFIFDSAIIGSTSKTVPAIRAGAFNAASNIKLIFTNNCKISAIGGNGGNTYIRNITTTEKAVSTTSATSGGVVYQSDGIASSLYLNYGDVDGYTTSADFYAPGGGGAGVAGITSGQYNSFDAVNAGAAASGGGGAGIPAGTAGIATVSSDSISGSTVSKSGFDGTFFAGGNGVTSIASDSEYITVGGVTIETKSTSTSGVGGTSANGGSATFLPEFISGGTWSYIESIGTAGLSGAAIKGANVVVYNLASSASKLRSGNSDAFTLITA